MLVIQDGTRVLELEEGAPADAPRVLLILIDAETGSTLGIDPTTGREIARTINLRETDTQTRRLVWARLNQIVASIRLR